MGLEILIALGVAGLVVALASTARPEPLTYTFVAVSLLFPKFLMFSIAGEPIQGVRALEFALAAALVVSVVRYLPRERPPISREARIVLAVGVAMVGFFTVRALLGWNGLLGSEQIRTPGHLPGGGGIPGILFSEVPVTVPALKQLFALSLPAYGVLFFYVGLRFFRSAEKLERLLRVLIAVAVVGSVEGLFFPLLHIAPALEDPGGMGVIQAGLTLGGRDVVVHTVLFAVVAVLYLSDWPRANRGYLLLLPLFGMAIIGTFSYPGYAGVALAATVYVVLRQGVRGKVATIDLALLVCGFALILVTLVGIVGVLDRAGQGGIEGDLFSFSYRMDLWAFATDWIGWSFPFGLGPGAVPFYFEASSIGRSSSAHNLPLEWVAELGLLGLLGLLSSAWLVLKNFGRWNRHVGRNPRRARAALLGAAIFSMLAGSLVVMQVDSTVRIFSVYALLMASTELVGRGSDVAGRRNEPVKSRPARSRPDHSRGRRAHRVPFARSSR